MIPILLAEEQGMVRGALAALLAFEPDLEIVAQASSGDEVLAAARRTHPDAALLDIEMPGTDGLEAAAQLKRELPDCTIVILTTSGARATSGAPWPPEPPASWSRTRPRSGLPTRFARPRRANASSIPSSPSPPYNNTDSPLTARERDVLDAGANGTPISEMA